MPDPRLCPTCDGSLPIGFGRPRTYCSVECRREMARRRHRLDELEELIVEARTKLRDGYAPGRYFWRKQLVWFERTASEVRQGIPGATSSTSVRLTP